jgi:hypothetical protein
MPGLDPGIHKAEPLARSKSDRLMDCRVKPGNDEKEERSQLPRAGFCAATHDSISTAAGITAHHFYPDNALEHFSIGRDWKTLWKSLICRVSEPENENLFWWLAWLCCTKRGEPQPGKPVFLETL